MKRGWLVIGMALALATAVVPQQTEMTAAAKALMSMLEPEQLKKIQLPFDSDERFNWYYIPRERQGLPLKQMTERQRTAAFLLLHVGLSPKGYNKAESIRSLEIVLHEIEQAARRDPELYYFTIFGDPSDRGTWGWRYEGHHISQHWTVVNGAAVSTTPAFFGANPAEVQSGARKGFRALPAEEDLGRALLDSLDGPQRQQAIINVTSPNDIVTTNARKAAIEGNAGLPAQSMTKAQQGLLMSLVENYATSAPDALAAARLAKVRAEGLADIHFAWMGSTKPGLDQGHYYRNQGKQFLIEYDDTQDHANHQHTVWRDFDGDFGLDVLAKHYEKDHARR